MHWGEGVNAFLEGEGVFGEYMSVCFIQLIVICIQRMDTPGRQIHHYPYDNSRGTN